MQKPVGTSSQTSVSTATLGFHHGLTASPGSLLAELEKAPSEVRTAPLPADFHLDHDNPFHVELLKTRTEIADDRDDSDSDADSLSYESHLTVRAPNEFAAEVGSLHAPSPVAITPSPTEQRPRRPHSAPPAIHSR